MTRKHHDSRRPDSIAPIIAICLGPLVWFLHLAALYAAETLACAFPGGSINMRAIGLGATMLALGLLVVAPLLFRGRRETIEPHPFLHRVMLLLTVLAGAAIVWTAIPLATVSACAAS